METYFPFRLHPFRGDSDPKTNSSFGELRRLAATNIQALSNGPDKPRPAQYLPYPPRGERGARPQHRDRRSCVPPRRTSAWGATPIPNLVEDIGRIKRPRNSSAARAHHFFLLGLSSKTRCLRSSPLGVLQLKVFSEDTRAVAALGPAGLGWPRHALVGLRPAKVSRLRWCVAVRITSVVVCAGCPP